MSFLCWSHAHLHYNGHLPVGSRNPCMTKSVDLQFTTNLFFSPAPDLINHVLNLCICGVLAQGPHDCRELLNSSVFIIHLHKLSNLTLVVMVPSWFLSKTIKASLKVASPSEVRDSRIFFLSASLKAVMSLKWRKYYCWEQSTVGARWGGAWEDTPEDLSMNRRELYYGGLGINGRENLLQFF